jgi:hypothetical protein
MRCRGLQEFANTPYLSCFLCNVLPCVAPVCVHDGVRMASMPPSYLSRLALSSTSRVLKSRLAKPCLMRSTPAPQDLALIQTLMSRSAREETPSTVAPLREREIGADHRSGARPSMRRFPRSGRRRRDGRGVGLAQHRSPMSAKPGKGQACSDPGLPWQWSIHDPAYRSSTTRCRGALPSVSPEVDELGSEPCGFEGALYAASWIWPSEKSTSTHSRE